MFPTRDIHKFKIPELKGGKNSVRMNHTYMGEISDNDFIRVSSKTYFL